MRYTILGFNQLKALEYKLDMKDLLILDWLNKFYPKMNKHIENEQEYVWVQYKHLLEDLPILDISSSEIIGRRFTKFCEKGLLVRKDIKDSKFGTFTYFGFTDKYFELFSDTTFGSSADTTFGSSENKYTNNQYTISFSKEKETKRTAEAVISEPPTVSCLDKPKNEKPEAVGAGVPRRRYDTKKSDPLSLGVKEEPTIKTTALDRALLEVKNQLSYLPNKIQICLDNYFSMRANQRGPKYSISKDRVQQILDDVKLHAETLTTAQMEDYIRNSTANKWGKIVWEEKSQSWKDKPRADANMDADMENVPGRGVSSGIEF